MSGKTFYITTPIYYVNDAPHIGTAYCTLAADVCARYRRQRGLDVRFTTGTDEHGEKAAQSAQAAGLDPQAYCDKLVVRFKDAWAALDIVPDDFIRTTEARHKASVRRFVSTLLEKGDIYKGNYEGWYCVHEESFYPESKLIDARPCAHCTRGLVNRDGAWLCAFCQGPAPWTLPDPVKACPECTRPVKRVSEENYFFRLSHYQTFLKDLFESSKEIVVPAYRRAEMESLLAEGLTDVSVSRSTFKWGIPFPADERHVIYVWFEALMNYVSSVGFGEPGSDLWRYWPADVHLIGKDIARFHTLLWPAMLHAAGVAVPRKVFLTGFVTDRGQKLSKSQIAMLPPEEQQRLKERIDPLILAQKFGADTLRYTLLREVALGQDGEFNKDALIARANAELANDIGNLLNRTLSMAAKYRQSRVPAPAGEAGQADLEVEAARRSLPDAFAAAMDQLAFTQAMEESVRFARRLNKYVDESAPWTLAKTGDVRLDRVLFNLLAGLRVLSGVLAPFLPRKSVAMAQLLGLPGVPDYAALAATDGVPPGTELRAAVPLFPRIQE